MSTHSNTEQNSFAACHGEPTHPSLVLPQRNEFSSVQIQ
jgi:hypothetical protein